MSEYFFVAAQGILGIRTNLRRFQWSFGTVTPPATQDAYDRCAVRLQVRTAKGMERPNKAFGKYHYFSGRPGEDRLYYSRPLAGGIQLRIEAEGLLGCEPVITFNKAYLRCVTHRFMNVHSAGYILTDLAALLLLHRGYTPLHCSAFQTGDSTVVVAAPPNMGKTLTTMTACMEHGASFLAEDIAISDGSTIYSVPWTSTFRFYNNIDRSWRSRLGGALQHNFPPVELLPLRNRQPITRYIPAEKLLNSAPATHLVILERGSEGMENVDVETAHRKLRNLNRYEFNYARAPLVVAHEFFNPEMDVTGACETEHRILRALAENVRERVIVRATSATRYADMIVGRFGESRQAVKSRQAA